MGRQNVINLEFGDEGLASVYLFACINRTASLRLYEYSYCYSKPKRNIIGEFVGWTFNSLPSFLLSTDSHLRRFIKKRGIWK